MLQYQPDRPLPVPIGGGAYDTIPCSFKGERCSRSRRGVFR